MKIRVGSTPGIVGRVGLKRRVASPRDVISGRIIRPEPAPVPHLPPVHFYAEADVAAGAEATLRNEALSNRTGRPVEIHEIRLSAFMDFAGAVAGSWVDLGGIARFRLSAGGKPITNAFVPMWNVGKIENRVSQIVGSNGMDAINTTFVWRLSRPWHIPNGMPVECQFQHSGAINTSINAKIGLAGNFVDRKSTTSFFPYATAYVSRAFDYSSTLLTDESSERDLVNMTGKTLTVDRIIGRVGVVRSTANALTKEILDFDDAAVDDTVTIRMVTSNNLPIIPEFASIRQVFGYYPSSIDIEHEVDPGDFYRVSVRKVAGAVLADPYTTYTAQVNISAVGWRQEAI